MPDKLKWGIIGAGIIANKFAQDIKLINNAEVVAIASSSKERAEVFAKRHDIPNAYSDYVSLINNESIDVVYIATPHSFHKDHTLLALERGKHVLCEKPVAINVSETKAMINKAREKSLFFMEALWTDFLPHIKYIKSFIDGGGIGKIKYLNASFGFAFNAQSNPRYFDHSIGGGSLLDLGIYPVYLTYKFLGKPDTVQATAVKASNGVDLQCAMQFHYEESDAQLFSSMETPLSNTAEIVGTDGKISIPASFQGPVERIEVTHSKTGKVEVVEFERVKGTGLEYQLLHVNECILRGETESDLWGHRQSIEVMELLDEVRRQTGIEYHSDKSTSVPS